MVINNKQKDKMRRVIRLSMIALALLLLFWAVVLPIINNGVALGIENDLKEELAAEEHLEIVDSISVAGRLSPFTNDMQYFGAVLVKSDLSEAELEAYFEETLFDKRYNCTYEKQASAEISLKKTHNLAELSFDTIPEGTCYIVYRYGQAPGWLQDLLNTDLR